MSIIASSNGNQQREIIPAGNYIARAYQFIELGTITEDYMGEPKTNRKVRIGWEFPTETRVFKEEHGEQPFVLSKELTLSMHEKSNLRKMLTSWRGKNFTDEEAHSFDVTKLVGTVCMINVIHKKAKNDNVYPEINNISTVPKGMHVPKAYNPVFVLSYDDFSIEKFNSLPDFIKNKMRESLEYKEMMNPHKDEVRYVNASPVHFDGKKMAASTIDDLPF